MSRKPSMTAEVHAVAAVGGGLSTVLPEDQRSWWNKPHLRKLNFIMFSCILFSSANGYDGSMMNGLQALPLWHEFMHNPKGAWLGFINAVQSLGAVVAIFPCVWITQRYGRKIGVYIGYLFLILAVTLQTTAPNVGAFVAARFFLGFTTQFYSISAPLLITETSYPTHRGICTALYNCGWYVGSLIAAWATFGTRNYTTSWAWRVPSLLQIAIPIICLPGLLMAPESPRYLVSVDKIEEARKILADYHNGGVHDAFIDYQLDEIVTTLRMEKEANESTSWLDLFKTKGNRHRALISITLGIFAQWNGVGVVSYYLSLVLSTAGITDVTSQTLINGCIQIWNLIWAVSAAFSVDKLGRRKLFLASSVGMLISYICITGLSGSFAVTGVKNVGIAVIPFLFLFYGSYDIAFTPLIISYTAEIWPYNLRSRGLASCLLSTQLAVFFNIFVNPIALEAIGWKYYIVFVVILVIIIITVWFFYPETKGHTLEEMAVVFDGMAAAAPTETEILEKTIRRHSADPQASHKENVV